MSTSSRRRFQRLALTTLGLLLLVIGASRFAHAVEQWFRGQARHSVEVTVDRRATVHKDERRTSGAVLYDRTFNVRRGGSLDLDLGSENVTVRTVSGDRARVTVEGRGRDAEREFERRQFSARVDGDRLIVRTEPQRRGRRSSARFEVTVEIPRRFDAALDLGSGNVQVASLDGDLAVSVGSGNVRVEDIDGRRVRLSTGSGNVQAGALVGDVEVRTGSGNVRVERVVGPLEAGTGSGNVAIGSVDGRASVDTGSGNVEMTLASAAPLEVDTGSGTVTLLLPRSAGFDIDLDGGSVQIDDAFGFQGRRERREAEGRIGGGGPELTVDTGSGDIRLRAR